MLCLGIERLGLKIKNRISWLVITALIVGAETASCSSPPLSQSTSAENGIGQTKVQLNEEKSLSNSQDSGQARTEPAVQMSFAGSGGINAPEHRKKPVVVMISIDGFRADYLDKFNPPHLRALATAGIRASGMQASFPSSTFPNHVTLASGRFPGHHGIVSNSFYDKRRREIFSMRDIEKVQDETWYQTDMTWTVAERHHMVSASFFWVGSEAKIAGLPPTYSLPYDQSIPNDVRVSKVLEWLAMAEDRRPHLIHLYFADVDSMGHKYGTDSKEVRQAVLSIDHQIGRLFGAAARSSLPVNFVIVSDHGMQNLDPTKVIEVGALTDIKDLNPQERGALMMLYSEEESRIEKAYSDLKKAEQNFKVYRRSEIPRRFAFNHPDRVGDLVLIADLPYHLTDRITPDRPPLSNVAGHGWDPANPAMHALFIAQGPQIFSGKIVPVFQNIHVYPFVMSILGLPTGAAKGEPPVDGSLDVLKPYLNMRRLATTSEADQSPSTDSEISDQRNNIEKQEEQEMKKEFQEDDD